MSLGKRGGNTLEAKFWEYAIPDLTVREYGWIRRFVFGVNGELVVDRTGMIYVVRLSFN